MGKGECGDGPFEVGGEECARGGDGPGNPSGLAFERAFSAPGREYPEVERTAEIRDGKGAVKFRQEGLRFPEAYSQLAVNVVAGKYFYGDVENGSGDPREGRRESSMRQLVARVADTIAAWGEADGYFRDAASAGAFRDDLTAILMDQKAAFNSPVWFNVGLFAKYGVRGDTAAWRWDAARGEVVRIGPGEAYEHPTASACFIQGVEDSMDSIMDLAKAEAMLFKGGSGTGTDLSPLRSTREKLTGGGRPSGPVSFFRVYDAVASVVKSGGKNRRAARMQTLKVTHPDVMEFVACKVEEDRKARALIAAGWSAGMTGAPDEAYSSVAFQNTNISVRVTDEFMRKAAGEDPDPRYWTRAVTDGREVEELDAREVLRRVAEGTWECGDPGMQFDDTVNGWNTAADTERINSSNPCSEYMYVDNSACNLASLNLMKFVREDGSFDCGAFEAAVRVVFTAQEVLVGRASYPTEKIAANSHAHRPLGLGYANLGAMLMNLGIPYDSDAGRDLAGAVTALMQAAAGRTSVELARAKGPYPAFAANRGSMLRAAGRHAEAAASARSAAAWAGGPESRQAWGDGPSAPIWDRACRVWEMETVPGGEIHGYRNAQWSVMAPTGTIAFLMDCDTTGIEPDIALVKYKALAGGGNLRIVNTGVAAALRRLGYGVVVDDVCNGDISRYDQVAGILRHIEENDTIEGAPGLKPEHLPVFDCAFESTPGGRTISWEGHVRMMAAVQPFVSGAISKTINLPNSATVDDIRDAYVLSWRLGLKAVAIYRDGSKGVQPLTTRKVEEAPAAEPFPEEEKARRFAALDAIMGHAFGLAGERAEPGAVYPTDVLERTAEFLRGRGAGGDGASAGPPSLIRAAGFPKSSDRIAAEDLRESRFDVRDAARAKAVDAHERAVVERAVSDLLAAVEVAEEAPAPPPKPAPRRERLPDTRRAVNHKFNVGGHEGYINVGLYRDGRPGELFITMAKEGSTIGGLMDAIGTLTSIGLQYGVPMEVLARKLSHVRFEPSGFTKNPDVPMAKSVVDYVFRWLGNEFVAGFRGENAPARPADGPAPAEALEYEAPPAAAGRGPSQEDAPACAECGAITVRTGACYTCTQCGSSSGCG